MSAITSTKSRDFYVDGQNLGTVVQTYVSFDDANDVTIATPTSPACIFLLALQYSVTAAHTLTLKSGSDVIASFPFSGATSLISGYINTGMLLTGPGEALKASLSIAGNITFLTTTSHAIAAAFLKKTV